MNSFNLTLSGKHFICPSILNESFAGYSNIWCRSLPSMTSDTSFQPLLACKVSFDYCTPAVTAGPYFSLSSKDLGDKERRGFVLPSLVFLFYHEHFVLSCEYSCGWYLILRYVLSKYMPHVSHTEKPCMVCGQDQKLFKILFVSTALLIT